MKLEDKLKKEQSELNSISQKLEQLNETRKLLAQRVFITQGRISILQELINETNKPV